VRDEVRVPHPRVDEDHERFSGKPPFCSGAGPP
jgi:hypothetical protein